MRCTDLVAVAIAAVDSRTCTQNFIDGRTIEYDSLAMSLTEETFSALIDAGCTQCHAKKLVIESYVTQKLPLLDGELYGAPTWDYRGEDLVRGTWQIACGACKAALYRATACMRCGAEGGVARALETPNSFHLPEACAACAHTMLTASAYVTATVVYDARTAKRPRTQTERDDAGFHAFRVECKSCRSVSERRTPCPLCAV
jgi:hypothetical protein